MQNRGGIKGILVGLFLTVALVICPAVCQEWSAAREEVNVDTLLAEAENKRTSDTITSAQLLKDIEKNWSSLTQAQRHRWQFLTAYSHAITGDLTSSIDISKKLINSPFTDTRIKAHLLLANSYEARKSYSEAYHYLYEAIQDVGQVSDSVLQANVYTVATQLHISAGAYKQAIEFADAIGQASDSARSQCISLSQKMRALIRMQQKYPQPLLQKAIDACMEASEPLLLHSIDVFTAEVDIVDNPALVKANMTEIMPALEAIGFPYTLASARYYLALARFKLGEREAAMDLARQVHGQASRIGDSHLENQSLLLLAEILEQNGQARQAMDNYKAHIRALNRFMDEFKQRKRPRGRPSAESET